MNSPAPKLPAALREMGTFMLPVFKLPDDENKSYSFHKSVLRPLLDRATEVRVFNVKPASPLGKLLKKFASPSAKNWILDLSRECLTGREPLWNCYCCHFGIAIVTGATPDDLAPILYSTGRPSIWKSLYQLHQASSKGAVSFSQRQAAAGKTVFLFSGTNGPEWLDVFAPLPNLAALYATAKRKGNPKLSHR